MARARARKDIGHDQTKERDRLQNELEKLGPYIGVPSHHFREVAQVRKGSLAPPVLTEALGSPGSPIDSETQSFVERHLDYNFSNVRVHADSNSARSARAVNARAFTLGRDLVFGQGQYRPRTSEGRRLILHELAHVAQQQWQTPGIQLDEAPKKKESKLLQDFAVKFPDAADLIRKSEPAMKLVNEADAAGSRFGGYAEDGPGKDTWPYTSGNAVYVPKARKDKVLAMKAFLFELNNAIRAPKFAELDKEATKGTKGSLTAKEYARKIVEQEVEGMLRLGQVWFETKKTIGKGSEWNKYDNDFYLSEYTEFKEGKKTKDDLVKEVLKRVYSAGVDKGKTVEKYYMDEYNSLAGGK